MKQLWSEDSLGNRAEDSLVQLTFLRHFLETEKPIVAGKKKKNDLQSFPTNSKFDSVSQLAWTSSLSILSATPF